MKQVFSAVILTTLVWVTMGPAHGEDANPTSTSTGRYAIAIHGGCGTADRLVAEKIRHEYLESLTRAPSLGRKLLSEGKPSLDVVEQVARAMEDDANFNAGKGAVFNRNGEHELDASIMDGRNLACGAVAGVRTVKNPISLARLVMERTNHVLLASGGAERFAREAQVELVKSDYFFTPRLRDIWDEYRKKGPVDVSRLDLGIRRGTIGVVALDVNGNLAAATSTGGTCFKMPGRVGDSPIIGAGSYAKNNVCAVSCTGRGEEFIRLSVAHTVTILVEHTGMTVANAAGKVIHEKLAPGMGGLIAVGQDGSIAMPFNTQAMLRGAADSNGRFDVMIWDAKQ